MHDAIVREFLNNYMAEIIDIGTTSERSGDTTARPENVSTGREAAGSDLTTYDAHKLRLLLSQDGNEDVERQVHSQLTDLATEYIDNVLAGARLAGECKVHPELGAEFGRPGRVYAYIKGNFANESGLLDRVRRTFTSVEVKSDSTVRVELLERFLRPLSAQIQQQVAGDVEKTLS